MINVILLGGGNLAYHLTNEFLNNAAINLVQVYNRSLASISYLKGKTAITNDIKQLKEADIYMLCVSDNAISELSIQLIFKNKLVVHTSGAMGLNTLKSTSNKGVFYPLQSFSKEKEVNFSNIPIGIEANRTKDEDLLMQLAKAISKQCYLINSEQRKHLHVAAVFVNNFVNHMYVLGNEICDAHQIPFEILTPLIQETALKLSSLSPFEAQTGPAKRNDSQTIETHLSLICENQQKIYKLLTQSIKNTYGKKL
ncbi:Rossmann-like and DUF2520 domain-containing protein [Lutibacter holmesii]|uniref:Rossmann-like and DUF2520 domain-containing protein n=1 Tax=Lutibacter holmesii TaxID=1137985 RepID=A0ABW3WN94_9FLAO